MASIYVHIPFCERKCIYCDFYSIEDHLSVGSFIDALKREIQMCSTYAALEQIETIYLGGGTPSLLESKDIRKIIDQLHRVLSINPNAEVTIELNPGTVDRDKLVEYHNLGINRLSVGVQSFREEDLKFLTRIHSVENAIQTIKLAKEIGFNNISFDLIYALPSQTLSDWERNLKTAVDLEPQHISAYSLIVEEGTPLARMVSAKQVSPLNDVAEAEMYELAMQFLEHAGYEHYEVSNYAKSRYQSRHNCNYWNHSNYIGLGPSAHSFWAKKRWWNVSKVESYCESISSGKLPIAGSEELSTEQLFDESVMLGLRTGVIDFCRLKSEYGIDLFASSNQIIQDLVSEQLGVLEKQVLRLTNKGFLLCDAISERLLASIFVV